MKYKIVQGDFNQKTGISTVTIATKYGNFTGTSKVADQEAFPSKYEGCNLAEIRAVNKCYEYQIRNLNVALKAIENFQKNLQSSPYYSSQDSVWFRQKIEKYIQHLTSEKKKLRSKVSENKANINTMIITRDIVLKNHAKKKAKKEKS